MTDPYVAERRQAERRDSHARFTRLYRAAMGLVVVWAVLASFGILALGINTINDHAALNRANQALAGVTRNAKHLIIQTLHGCIRLNIIRASSNQSQYLDYKVAAQQIKFQSVSLRGNYLALKKIGIPIKILNRSLRQTETLLASQKVDVLAKTWIPLTNCTARGLAANGTYEPPGPIPFRSRIPPAAAMSAANGRLPDPVGSLPPQ